MERMLNSAYKNIKSKVLLISPLETKVLEATSNDPWGPHGTVLSELAENSRHFEECQEILTVLFRRMEDEGKDWRHVYKSMAVLEFLVAQGSQQAVRDIRSQAHVLTKLKSFFYIEPSGKDQGLNVREKAAKLQKLLEDPQEIEAVREKARINKNKYTGVSSTDSRMGSSGFSSSSSTFTSSTGYDRPDRTSSLGQQSAAKPLGSNCSSSANHYKSAPALAPQPLDKNPPASDAHNWSAGFQGGIDDAFGDDDDFCASLRPPPPKIVLNDKLIPSNNIPTPKLSGPPSAGVSTTATISLAGKERAATGNVTAGSNSALGFEFDPRTSPGQSNTQSVPAPSNAIENLFDLAPGDSAPGAPMTDFFSDFTSAPSPSVVPSPQVTTSTSVFDSLHASPPVPTASSDPFGDFGDLCAAPQPSIGLSASVPQPAIAQNAPTLASSSTLPMDFFAEVKLPQPQKASTHAVPLPEDFSGFASSGPTSSMDQTLFSNPSSAQAGLGANQILTASSNASQGLKAPNSSKPVVASIGQQDSSVRKQAMNGTLDNLLSAGLVDLSLGGDSGVKVPNTMNMVPMKASGFQL